LPHLATVADDIAFLKAVQTDQFNHGPAQLLMHTGSARLGRPSIGAWATYGLGSENSNLPGFVVLTSGGKFPDAGKSVWGSGFCHRCIREYNAEARVIQYSLSKTRKA